MKYPKEYLELNAELSKHWPRITEVKPPLNQAKKWDGVTNKIQYLDTQSDE